MLDEDFAGQHDEGDASDHQGSHPRLPQLLDPACNDEGISRRDDGAGIRRVNRQLEIALESDHG